MVYRITFFSSCGMLFYSKVQVRHVSEIRHNIKEHVFKAQCCQCLRLRQGRTKLSESCAPRAERAKGSWLRTAQLHP